MRKKFLTLALAGLALGACGDNTGPGDGEGRLTIQLTDAPGDMADAFISIDRITLIGATEDAEGETLEFDLDGSEYINLLDLSGGEFLDLVEGEDVPAGQYSELRIYLNDAYVVLADGRVFATNGADLPAGVEADGELKCPSCSQSGYKVKFMDAGLEVDEDDETVVRIDFDVGQSFGHEAGQAGKWIMHPVLRATTNNFARASGAIAAGTGTTFPLACGSEQFGLDNLRVPVTLGGETYTGLVTAGTLRFSTLVPGGTYTFPTQFTQTLTNGWVVTVNLTASPTSVSISQWGQAELVSFTVTATCAAGT